MLPSGSGDKGKYCCSAVVRRKGKEMSKSSSIKESRRNLFYGCKQKTYTYCRNLKRRGKWHWQWCRNTENRVYNRSENEKRWESITS